MIQLFVRALVRKVVWTLFLAVALVWAVGSTGTWPNAWQNLTAVAYSTSEEPSTAAGYQKMLSKVIDEAGAGDVSLSVRMADGRVVWMYGDTMSKRNGFVHSAAIVQDGGVMEASHDGEQLLPNDSKKAFYWIEDAEAVSRKVIHVTAAPIRKTGEGVWGFERRGEQSRVAKVVLSKAGDVTFRRWVGYTERPANFVDLAIDGDHMTYEHRAHPWATLANGRVLMTHANNWDLGDFKRKPNGAIDYKAYMPTFYAGDGIERRAW